MDCQELHSEKFMNQYSSVAQKGHIFGTESVPSELYQTKSLRSVLVELIQIWFTVWYQIHPQKFH